jgi:hypothetical protein
MVAAMVPVVLDNVTNLPAPKPTLLQLLDEGSVLAVQVMPSGEVAAAVDAVATAKNELFP